MTADDEAHGRVDPRYDPAFQRGYRPDPARVAPRRDRGPVAQPAKPVVRDQAAPVDRDQAAPPRIGPATPARERFAPDASSFSSAPEWSAAIRDERIPAEDPTDEDTLDDDESLDDADRDEPAALYAPVSRTNPYVVALWIIGIALIVLGVGWQVWAQLSSANTAYSVQQQTMPLVAIVSNLAYTVAVPMITVGVGTVVGVIFLAAVDHRVRSGSR